MEDHDHEALKFRSWWRMVSVLALGVLLLFSTCLYLQLPRVERVFQDMLGSSSRFPGLTRLMFEWGRLSAAGLATQFLIGGGAMMCAFMTRARFAGAGAAAGIVLLALHCAVCAVAVFVPLMQLMSGLGAP